MLHNFIPRDRFFAYLTWHEIDQMSDKENVVLLQPLGAIEQHGAHLPLVVDCATNLGVLGKALTELDSNIPAYSLPPLYYGKSNEHATFPGTIALSAITLSKILMELADSMYYAGFRKLVFLNSHGGQCQLLETVARDIHVKYPDFMIFPLFLYRVPNIAKDLISPKEWELGIHGGDVETSLILALLPDQVDMEQAVMEYPQNLPESSLLSMEGALPFAWVTSDLSKSGVIGDATVATKEKGDRLLASLAAGWVQVIRDIYIFRQPTQVK